jgi:hypothetical protein
MAFFTIELAPDLGRSARRRGRAAGPRAVDARGDHAAMLQRAGCAVVVARDVTEDFLATARAWLGASEAHAAELAALEPPGGFEERQADRRAVVAAIEDGLLRRTLYVAVRRERLPR